MYVQYIIVYLSYGTLTEITRKSYANLRQNRQITIIHLYMATSENQKMIKEKYDFIDEWLPTRYTKAVNVILKDKKKQKNPAYIRQCKRERIENTSVIKALYAVAQLNKLQKEN